MKVKIGAIEISDVSHAELDVLIKRYGKIAGGLPAPGADNHDAGGAALSKDGIVLKRLIEAGNTGVKINDLGEILGKRGKAARGVIQKWSVRIGLGDATSEPFEDCRVGTARGLRIKANLMEVARALMAKPQS